MRWAYMPLALALAGCGYSADDVHNAELQAAANAAANAQKARDRLNTEADIDLHRCETGRSQAVDTRNDGIERSERQIKATLDNVTAQESTADAEAVWGFAVNIETLRPPEWAWTEREAGAGASNGVAIGRSDQIRYTVDPTRLVGTVRVTTYMGQPAVEISCAVGNCIRAVGSTIAHLPDGSQRARALDETRNSNAWAVRTQNRAEALATTMTELLGQINTPLPPVCVRRPVR